MDSHLEFAIEDNLRRGLSPDEARRQAMIRFGGVMQAKEQQREARGLPALDILMQDLTYSFRTLRRDRSFSVIAVLILALGIGANIAVFSVVNTILIRPLPFRDSGKCFGWLRRRASAASPAKLIPLMLMRNSERRITPFKTSRSYFAFSSSDNVKLTGHGQPKPATGIAVTGNFFQTLGVEPAMGTLFNSDETVKGARAVVLLSNAFWKSQYASDSSIVGKQIDLDGKPTTVVGVLPQNFDFGAILSPGSKVDLFTPAILDDMRDWG